MAEEREMLMAPCACGHVYLLLPTHPHVEFTSEKTCLWNKTKQQFMLPDVIPEDIPNLPIILKKYNDNLSNKERFNLLSKEDKKFISEDEVVIVDNDTVFQDDIAASNDSASETESNGNDDDQLISVHEKCAEWMAKGPVDMITDLPRTQRSEIPAGSRQLFILSSSSKGPTVTAKTA